MLDFRTYTWTARLMKMEKIGEAETLIISCKSVLSSVLEQERTSMVPLAVLLKDDECINFTQNFSGIYPQLALITF